jgi:hypothetical protein
MGGLHGGTPWKLKVYAGPDRRQQYMSSVVNMDGHVDAREGVAEAHSVNDAGSWAVSRRLLET